MYESYWQFRERPFENVLDDSYFIPASRTRPQF